MVSTISLIGFGEAGSILGQDFAALGLTVYAYDHALANQDARVAMHDKAKHCCSHYTRRLDNFSGNSR